MWDRYGLRQYELRAGSFREDSRGRWYLNVTIKVMAKERIKPHAGDTSHSIGIDLGLTEFAAFSDDAIPPVEAKPFYRQDEKRLAIAQRANKTHRVKAIHARITNRRKDHLHQLSTTLVRGQGAILHGKVNASSLAKTKHAQSVLDAGWSSFRTMLSYQCAHAGVGFEEVNEAYSTVTCSSCESRTGPKGLAGLRMRMDLLRVWTLASARHQRRQEHSRGGTSPSCRRHPRPFCVMQRPRKRSRMGRRSTRYSSNRKN